MSKTITGKRRQQRKFLLVLPLIAVPFLCIGFYAMGGGRGSYEEPKEVLHMGFNMELPAAVIDKKEDKMDKMAFYQRADIDSARRKEQLQMDPYRHKERMAVIVRPERPVTDTQAEVLMHKLDVLRKQVNNEQGVKRGPVGPVKSEPVVADRKPFVLPVTRRRVDTVAADPELEKLNEMLDKIARLQGSEPAVPSREKGAGGVKDVGGDKEISVGIPAVIENNQGLMNGATLAMRLTSALSYDGIVLPAGQLVYGMVTMSGDRMQVSVHSIRCGQTIITTYWQVYDLDGLQGIRIPDGLGRQVARQSADQGIGGLNLVGYDPSIGGQMAGAGIQVARNLLGRKVRAVRVMVPAGYQVLLRDTRAGGAAVIRVLADSAGKREDDPVAGAVTKVSPPPVDSLSPYLHVSEKEGKVRLTLKGVYLRDGLMWLYMTVKDKGQVAFVPGYVRCTVRPKKRWRRMAVQEVPVPLQYDSVFATGVNEERTVMVGMKPFVPGGDKRLVVQVGEGGGGRSMELEVAARIIRDIR